MLMGYHRRGDWCHVCGKRHYEAVDIFILTTQNMKKKTRNTSAFAAYVFSGQ